MLVCSECEPSRLKIVALHRDTPAKHKIEIFLKTAKTSLIKFQSFMGTMSLNKTAQVVSSRK
jgi:hypothetical protein